MSERKPWKYCVVGNIVHDHIDDNGVPRHGTSAFRGGAKVYKSLNEVVDNAKGRKTDRK